jgi:hypothetical protein
MATFDGTEQGNMSVDTPSLFNPTNLDATTVGHWVSALKAAGIGQAMLVAKHSTGFCLWPSQYTEFSVKNSPWMNGTGDVVKRWWQQLRRWERLVPIRMQRVRSQAELVLASEPIANVPQRHADHLLLVGWYELHAHLQCAANDHGPIRRG